MPDVAAIILAAGQATRFRQTPEETKLAADLNGKPLILHVAQAALASKAKPIYLVTGHAAAEVQVALTGLNVFVVHNSAYAQGLSTSLKTGIAALPGNIRGAVILLADMPFVTGDVIDRLIACFAAASWEPDAVVPVRNGRRGNPVLIGRKLFSDIAKLEGDHGAAALLKESSRQILECPIDNRAIEIDVDTRETLDQLNQVPLV